MIILLVLSAKMYYLINITENFKLGRLYIVADGTILASNLVHSVG